MAQTATSNADLARQINNKTKSSATINADGSLKVLASFVATNQNATHARVTFNGHTQTVTFGDGSGVATTSVDQYLNALQ